MIELGQKVKDEITGFVGIAICRCEYLNGCVQYHVSPPVDEKGNVRKDEWFDAAQLEVIDDGVVKPEIVEEKPRSGGVRLHPND